MREGLTNYRGKVLFILSGNDLVAQEFIALSQQDKRWRKRCQSITREIVKQANHTFSSQAWRDQVTHLTIQWLNRQDIRNVAELT
jgi:hypothetical protein